MEKRDNRDKYLIYIDKLNEKVGLLDDKFDELNNLASDGEDKANEKIITIADLVNEGKELGRKVILKKGYKKYMLDLLKLYGVGYIPELALLYGLNVLVGQAINLFSLAGFLFLISCAYISITALIKKSQFRGVVLPEAEARLEEIKNLISTLEEEKQEHLDKVVQYRSERDETNEEIVKLENDIEYILEARNKIIEMILKDAIESSYVDTESIDKDLEEKGILMELK